MEKAEKRCEKLKNVSFRNLNFASELPNDQFDLIVISEVAYYLSPEDWEIAILNLLNILSLHGQVILVHWLPKVHDYPQTGDEVHDTFRNLMSEKMKNIFCDRKENYRIDLWEKLISE
ncbi:hypothetical protein HNQ03_001998 [Chryseobacterium sp. 16F]|uniref:Nodulation protein S (NodS) n=1 Tax=Frigoriflavimonas asaccharolytica TaxID=2735899 RepID=A0A8J8KBU0_9FLAO|nr:hypothetical protein [Frigoriflavimonas asaccharolytica]